VSRLGSRRRRSRPSRLGAFARRHAVFGVLLPAGAALRGLAVYAYRPAFEFDGDSFAYLKLSRDLDPDPMRPVGYPTFPEGVVVDGRPVGRAVAAAPRRNSRSAWRCTRCSCQPRGGPAGRDRSPPRPSCSTPTSWCSSTSSWLRRCSRCSSSPHCARCCGLPGRPRRRAPRPGHAWALAGLVRTIGIVVAATAPRLRTHSTCRPAARRRPFHRPGRPLLRVCILVQLGERAVRPDGRGTPRGSTAVSRRSPTVRSWT
jgi:hypothetical protein